MDCKKGKRTAKDMRLWREPMSEKYIISIDQSTQGTKAMIFDRKGQMICRQDILLIPNKAGAHL